MKEKLQMTLQKYKESSQTIMNNRMPKKMDSLEKTDKLLERNSLPRLNQEEKKKRTVELPLVKLNQQF